jgi:hypothetical protein
MNYTSDPHVPLAVANPIGRTAATWNVGKIRTLNNAWDWFSSGDGNQWLKAVGAAGVAALIGQVAAHDWTHLFKHLIPDFTAGPKAMADMAQHPVNALQSAAHGMSMGIVPPPPRPRLTYRELLEKSR